MSKSLALEPPSPAEDPEGDESAQGIPSELEGTNMPFHETPSGEDAQDQSSSSDVGLAEPSTPTSERQEPFGLFFASVIEVSNSDKTIPGSTRCTKDWVIDDWNPT